MTEKGEGYLNQRVMSEFRGKKARLVRLLDEAERMFQDPRTSYFTLKEAQDKIESLFADLEHMNIPDATTHISCLKNRIKDIKLKLVLLVPTRSRSKSKSSKSVKSTRSERLKVIAENFDDKVKESHKIAALQQKLRDLEKEKLEAELQQLQNEKTSKEHWRQHDLAVIDEAESSSELGNDSFDSSPAETWDNKFDFIPPTRVHNGRYYTPEDSLETVSCRRGSHSPRRGEGEFCHRSQSFRHDSTSPHRRPNEISRQRGSSLPRHRPHLEDIDRNSNMSSRSSIENLADAIAGALKMTHIPAAEPGVFSGNPLEYPDWIQSFNALVDDSNLRDEAKLLHLKRYLAGPALDAVSGYFLLRSASAYADAKETLEQRFGNPYLIAEAFRSKLDNCHKIHSKDRVALRTFSDFLNQCVTAQKEIPDLHILNDMRELEKISSKLPDFMSHTWNRKVAETYRKRGHFLTFRHFAKFVQEESDTMNAPWITDHRPIDRPRQPRPSEQNRLGNRNFSRPEERRATTYASSTDAKSVPDDKKKCLLCTKVGHSLDVCRNFAKKTPEEKRSFVKEKSLCLACLQPGHRAKYCNQRSNCSLCKERHPTSLHGTERLFPATKKEEANQQNSQSANVHRIKSTTKRLTTMIVPVYLSTKSQPEKEMLVYALLDSQSDTTFVVDNVAEQLTDGIPTSLKLTTITDSITVSCKKYNNLTVRGLNSKSVIKLPASYSRDEIPIDKGHIPLPSTAERWPHLRHIAHQIAPEQQCPIGLLIGYDCPQALKPINFIDGHEHQPFAVETPLGWTVVGGGQDHQNSAFIHSIVSLPSITALSSEPLEVAYVQRTRAEEVGASELIQMLEQDFRDSSGHDCRTISVEEKKFLNILEENTCQRPDGFYEMPLPFKDGPPVLPNNRSMALRRLKSLENQLQKRPTYHKHYVEFMNDIIQKKEAERADPKDAKWYIPHHGVYHPQKPDKIRVVFDCSAKFGDKSLNDTLLQGPDLMNPLVGVLLRFRKEQVAFSCDIERMFHQFRVTEHHQDYLHFLWWEDGDLAKPPVDYRMTVHLFGAISSPACANFALKRIAHDHGQQKEAGKFLLRNFYVDDGLQSEKSRSAALTILKDAQEICAKGNLRLHKVTSNCQEVVKSITSDSEQKNSKSTSSLPSHNSPIEKALGLTWDTSKDVLRFKVTDKDHKDTRRGLLATIASVYDPLGLIAPYVLQGRLILQSTCKEQMGWDTQIPDALQCKWKEWKNGLSKLEELSVPRCLVPEDFGTVTKAELHNFSDASLIGYGQCSYLRLTNGENKIHCTLVMAKARVTPLKPTTVPRLELQAALLSAKIASKLQEELDIPDLQQVFWTDSKVVLGYINNEKAKFQIYVANRVEQIRKISHPEQWHYVPTLHNPADHASRGLNIDQMTSADSNWFKGPEFLWQSDFTPEPVETSVSENDPEVKASTLYVQKISFTSMEERTARFSNYRSLINAVAVIVVATSRKRKVEMSRLEARQKAEKNLIKALQKEAFGITEIPKDLEHFVDNDGLLRSSGRLKNSSESFDIKHPIILPKGSHVARLITLDLHAKTGHQGRNTTMNAIRNKGFWIIGCRHMASSVINKCIKCIKIRGKARGQKMANLPPERVEPSPPFTHCGIDVFGPFLVKEGRKECKRYGLIFTCLALRAVHVELLDDLTTDSFLNSLRCFIALRGKVRSLFCDCGTNFTGASQELKQSLRNLDNEAVSTQLLHMDCEFKFNPPAASHMGGIWERQIRTIRSVLSGIIDHSAGRLDSSSLRTFMYEAAAIVNSRPLTTENLERIDGPRPLSPNHLLTMKTDVIVPPPPGQFQREDLYLRKRWRKVQYLTDLFWKRWRTEYLQNIRSRQKWKDQIPNFEVDDIVLLQEDEPRSVWQVARIVETYPSQDGLVRKVKLLMSTSKLDSKGKNPSVRTFLIRPVHKLILLIPRS